MHPELAKLDRALRRKGEHVTLQRRIGASNSFTPLPCRAIVRGHHSEALVGGLRQQDSNIVLSPSPMVAATDWPGAAGGDPWPRHGDVLVVRGNSKAVQDSITILMDGRPVRIEMRVRG